MVEYVLFTKRLGALLLVFLLNRESRRKTKTQNSRLFLESFCVKLCVT